GRADAEGARRIALLQPVCQRVEHGFLRIRGQKRTVSLSGDKTGQKCLCGGDCGICILILGAVVAERAYLEIFRKGARLPTERHEGSHAAEWPGSAEKGFRLLVLRKGY